jgi:hypothetical protein
MSKEFRSMRKNIWVTGALAALLISPTAHAETYVSDRAAALVVYPFLISAAGLADTEIQLTNTSNQLARVQCFYVNATGRCSLSDTPCFDIALGEVSGCPLAQDICIPQWLETDFLIFITARQPLAWQVGEGLRAADIPLDGVAFRGPTGESNAGTRVPPFADEGVPAIGELKCYVVDGEGNPTDRNVLKGEATIVATDAFFEPGDSAKYNAVGFRAIEGANNGDNQLRLGGEGAEYDGCPNVLILNHFFDFAPNFAFDSPNGVGTILNLVPCTENFVNQFPTRVKAQYLVFNEFEQRFSTSSHVDCFFADFISLIDTPDPTRSIFSVFVGGTITGQTRIRGVDGGLIGVAIETVNILDPPSTMSAFNLHIQGEREGQSDIVTVFNP